MRNKLLKITQICTHNAAGAWSHDICVYCPLIFFFQHERKTLLLIGWVILHIHQVYKDINKKSQAWLKVLS